MNTSNHFRENAPLAQLNIQSGLTLPHPDEHLAIDEKNHSERDKCIFHLTKLIEKIKNLDARCAVS